MRSALLVTVLAVLARPICELTYDVVRAWRATLTLHRMDLRANPTSGL